MAWTPWVAQIPTLAKIGASDFMARSVDFPNDYKTIGLRESPLGASAVCFVQPFGISRSPENWGIVVTFIQFIAKELPTLTVGAFAGDVYCAEPTHLATRGFWDLKRLAGLLGFPTSDKKDQPP